MPRARASTERGLTVIELTISVTFLVIVFGAALVALDHETRSLRGLSRSVTSETRGQELLARLEQLLIHAAGASPEAHLVNSLDSSTATGMYLDSLAGFPDVGAVLLERGEASEERVAYDSSEPGDLALTGLSRALQCTDASSHPSGSLVLWAGLAEPLDEQASPPAGSWDGLALELTGQVYFRGDGTGFSFRVPVDPDQDGLYVEDGEATFGASVAGADSATGWSAVYYEADGTFLEAGRLDVNRDGDLEDTFDVGRLRFRTWDTVEDATPLDVALCPSILLQEACNRGGDMDGDGFDDPMFLWDKDTGSLHVRLTILSESSGNLALVQRGETVLFLHNAAAAD